MFVDAAVEPAPSVRRRVLRVRHVGGSIEAPFGAGLAPELASAAKDTPDGLRSRRVPRMVLLMILCLNLVHCSLASDLPSWPS